MLLPPLCTQSEYVQYAKDAGLKVHTEPFDISKEVSKTWYVVVHKRDLTTIGLP